MSDEALNAYAGGYLRLGDLLARMHLQEPRQRLISGECNIVKSSDLNACLARADANRR
jgi:hypothetical protein